MNNNSKISNLQFSTLLIFPILSLFSGIGLYDLIKIADYIITDYSALSIEASLLEKPIFIYNYDIDEYEKDRGLNVKFEEELKTFTSKKFSDIMRKIEKDDFDIREIIKYKEKYIEVDIKNTTTKLSKFILSLF